MGRPAIVVSAYARAGYISPTNYEFGSILRYIEDNWSLGRLGAGDSRANSLIDCFDYAQHPLPFALVRTDYDASYFMHQRPYNAPLDDD